MLTILLGLLNSAGIGSVVGMLGGLANRILDGRDKKLDHKFELDKMDKQKDLLVLEAQNRLEVAAKEAEGQIESAAYSALAASYNFAAPTREDGWVDKVSKTIRPLLTFLFFAFTAYITYKIMLLVIDRGLILDDEFLKDLFKYIIQWVFFQAGTAIGWWFAMRPGKAPDFGGK